MLPLFQYYSCFFKVIWIQEHIDILCKSRFSVKGQRDATHYCISNFLFFNVLYYLNEFIKNIHK